MTDIRYPTHAEYLKAMKDGCPQFEAFGVEPRWRPGEYDVTNFIYDEVIRQFHDPKDKADGPRRMDWMRAAWQFANSRSKSGALPTNLDIRRLGSMIETVNSRADGYRRHDVMVGSNFTAPFKLLPQLMHVLIEQLELVDRSRIDELRVGDPHPMYAAWTHYMPDEEIVDRFREFTNSIKTVDDWYCTFQLVHPFADGNGRVGKILHNWLARTLENPVLVRNYFGGNTP